MDVGQLLPYLLGGGAGAAILAAVDLAGIAAVIAAVGAIVLGLIARPRAGALPPPAGDQGADAVIMRELARENGQLDARVRALEAAMLRAGFDPREVPS